MLSVTLQYRLYTTKHLQSITAVSHVRICAFCFAILVKKETKCADDVPYPPHWQSLEPCKNEFSNTPLTQLINGAESHVPRLNTRWVTITAAQIIASVSIFVISLQTLSDVTMSGLGYKSCGITRASQTLNIQMMMLPWQHAVIQRGQLLDCDKLHKFHDPSPHTFYRSHTRILLGCFFVLERLNLIKIITHPRQILIWEMGKSKNRKNIFSSRPNHCIHLLFTDVETFNTYISRKCVLDGCDPKHRLKSHLTSRVQWRM